MTSGPPRLKELLEQVVSYVDLIYAAGAIIFVGLGIYIGFLYMTSQGNDEKLQEIRQRIGLWIVGFILFFGSALIVATIYNLFGVHECGDPTKPIVKPGFSTIFVDCE